MNNIDYNQSGGFPLSTQILAAGQEAYKNFNAFGNLAGSLAIISGCETINIDEVADGFVSIYGELLPFKSSTKSANVVIVENTDLRGFEDGSAKAVIYTRYVTFGSSVVEYPWANFRRPLTLFQLEDRLLNVERHVPIGLVAIWGKPADEIPLGWIEHTDLQGRVPVGYLDGHVNFGVLDGTVGTAQTTIALENLPPLNAKVNIAPNGDNPGDNMYGRSGSAVTKNFPVKEGAAIPITNIQPSRIVKFIQFVGF